MVALGRLLIKGSPWAKILLVRKLMEQQTAVAEVPTTLHAPAVAQPHASLIFSSGSWVMLLACGKGAQSTARRRVAPDV